MTHLWKTALALVAAGALSAATPKLPQGSMRGCRFLTRPESVGLDRHGEARWLRRHRCGVMP